MNSSNSANLLNKCDVARDSHPLLMTGMRARTNLTSESVKKPMAQTKEMHMELVNMCTAEQLFRLAKAGKEPYIGGSFASPIVRE